MYGGANAEKAAVQKINLHYGNLKEGTKDDMKAWGVKIQKKPKKKSNDLVFHEFACEWSSDRIEMFTNGVKIFTISNKKILDKWFNVDNAKMWIVQNHAIEKKFIVDDENYNSEYFVDYIRAYK